MWQEEPAVVQECQCRAVVLLASQELHPPTSLVPGRTLAGEELHPPELDPLASVRDELHLLAPAREELQSKRQEQPVVTPRQELHPLVLARQQE